MKFLIVIIGLVLSQHLFAQTQNNDKPKVFIDCEYCDKDYLISNINFADFVRDRKLADLQLMFQYNALPNGQEKIELRTFKPDEKCENSFKRLLEVNASEAKKRTLMANMMTLAILPIIENRTLLSGFSINYNSLEENKEEPVNDPWNNWTFNTRLSAWINGQSNYKSISNWSSIRAQKVLDNRKLLFSISQNQNNQSFIIGEENIKSRNLSRNARAHYIGPISKKWSYGLFASANTSTYTNISSSYQLTPAIEYNFFDYDQYNEKILKLSYRIINKYNNYFETTVFDKDEERLANQSLGLELSVNKQWGSINSSVYVGSYIHDPELYNINLWNSLDWNIAKGLSFNVSMSLSILQDQIELVEGDLSREDILLSQKQQQTNYDYWMNAGISYTFGSVYNNIINPRFGT